MQLNYFEIRFFEAAVCVCALLEAVPCVSVLCGPGRAGLDGTKSQQTTEGLCRQTSPATREVTSQVSVWMVDSGHSHALKTNIQQIILQVSCFSDNIEMH